MKLKTLKDLERYNEWEGFEGHVEFRELKQEAIKWVKFYMDKEKKTDMRMYRLLIIEFRNFHNITEEDLK